MQLKHRPLEDGAAKATSVSAEACYYVISWSWPKHSFLPFCHARLSASQPKRQLHKMSFTNLSNGEEVGRDPHSNYHRRSLCPDAAPRLSLIQLWNMTYHHKHYVTRRTRLHRKESGNMNLGIQILSNGTRTTESALGIGQRCTNAGSRSSWECSPSRPA